VPPARPRDKTVSSGCEVGGPAADPSDHREWLPVPGKHPEEYGVERVTPGDPGADTAGRAFGFPADVMRQRLDYLGTTLADHDRVQTAGPSTLLAEGQFDRGTVREAVLEGGYDETDPLEGHDLYERPAGQRVFSPVPVSGTTTSSSGPTSPRERNVSRAAGAMAHVGST